MGTGTYLGEYEFQAILGPARVAYLVRTGSGSGVRRAVAEACTRWGGQTEPIIPVRANGFLDPFWKQVIEVANLDGLVNIDVDDSVAKAVANRLKLGVVPIKHIDDYGTGSFNCNPLVVGDPAPTSPWAYAKETLDLWAIVAAGTFTPQAQQENQRSSQPLIGLSAPDQVARSQIAGTTAISRTTSQFGEWWASPGAYPSPAIIWFCNLRQQFKDCIIFWNCRALRLVRFDPMPMILLPEYDVENYLNIGPGVCSLFQNRPDEFSPDAFLASSRVSHERMEELARSWGMVPSTDEPRLSSRTPPPPVRVPPYSYLTGLDPRQPLLPKRRFGRADRFLVQVFTGGTDLVLRPRIEFHGGGRLKIAFASNLFDRYPKRPHVATLLHRDGVWHDDGLQLLTVTLPEYKFTIEVPSLDHVVGDLLVIATREAKMSDKGRTGESIAAENDAAVLLVPQMFETIRALTTRRSKRLFEELKDRVSTEADVELVALVADIGGRLERRSRDAAHIEGVSSAIAGPLLERLVSINWAERGLRIACKRCGVTSFVSLATVTDDARCPGCRGSQQYEATSTGPTVVYRLNALIDRASDQGVLPHLMAIAVLQRTDANVSLRPGTDVSFPDGTKAEVDLFGLVAGAVVSGEVKTSGGEFTPEQLKRDVKLSKRLGAEVHVMAWLGALPAEAEQSLQILADRSGLRVKLLDLDAERT